MEEPKATDLRPSPSCRPVDGNPRLLNREPCCRTRNPPQDTDHARPPSDPLPRKGHRPIGRPVTSLPFDAVLNAAAPHEVDATAPTTPALALPAFDTEVPHGCLRKRTAHRLLRRQPCVGPPHTAEAVCRLPAHGMDCWTDPPPTDTNSCASTTLRTSGAPSLRRPSPSFNALATLGVMPMTPLRFKRRVAPHHFARLHPRLQRAGPVRGKAFASPWRSWRLRSPPLRLCM
jgi:hypothetical protein